MKTTAHEIPNLDRAYMAISLREQLQSLLPQADVLNRSRQRFGLVFLAVGRDLCRIPLQPVVVQDVAIRRRIVVTAHPKADELPFLWTVSEPASASDLIHIDADLSCAWLRSGHQQSRCNKKSIPSHGFSPVGQKGHCGSIEFCKPLMTLACGWYWHHDFTLAIFFWCTSTSTAVRRV